MRISDWSSDVCSSDLRGILSPFAGAGTKLRRGALLLMTVGDAARGAAFVGRLLADKALSFEDEADTPCDGVFRSLGFTRSGLERLAIARTTVAAFRSEESRGGKGGVITC